MEAEQAEEHVCEHAGDGVTLHQYSPLWELPSMDPFCLKAQVLLKMVRVPFEVNNCNNQSISKKGRLPVLQDGMFFLEEYAIADHVLAKYTDIDQNLSNQQKADAYALSSLVENRLYYLHQWEVWMDQENESRVMKPAIAGFFPFPLSYIVPYLEHRGIEDRLNSMGIHSAESIHKEAGEIYNTLSHKLADSKYFFGELPTSLDATVFGHLVFQYFTPVKEDGLHSIIDQYPNLRQYILRMAREYLPRIPNVKYSKQKIDKSVQLREFYIKRGITVAAVCIIGITLIQSMRASYFSRLRSI